MTKFTTNQAPIRASSTGNVPGPPSKESDHDTRLLERPKLEKRIRPVIFRAPAVIFTPIRDTSGRPSGISIDLDRPGNTGLLGGFLDLEDLTNPVLLLDFGGLPERDARERVRQLLDDMWNGTYGDRDIRDRIAGRGDPAGLAPVAAIAGAAVAVANWFTKEPAGQKLGNWMAGVAMGIVATVGSVLITNALGLTGAPEKKPAETPPPDAGVPPGGTPPEDPPPDGGKKTPTEDESGGQPTKRQIVQVRVEIKNYVPPMRDDRDDQPSGVGLPDRPIDLTDPAINWGPDPRAEKYAGITTRIIDDPGYLDPIPY